MGIVPGSIQSEQGLMVTNLEAMKARMMVAAVKQKAKM